MPPPTPSKPHLISELALACSATRSAGEPDSKGKAPLYKVEGNKVDPATWVDSKIHQRTFGRGCGTCHDVAPNPNVLESIPEISGKEFGEIMKNDRGAMPKTIIAIMRLRPVKRAGMTKDQAIDAIYASLKGKAAGDIPAGKPGKTKEPRPAGDVISAKNHT